MSEEHCDVYLKNSLIDQKNHVLYLVCDVCDILTVVEKQNKKVTFFSFQTSKAKMGDKS